MIMLQKRNIKKMFAYPADKWGYTSEEEITYDNDPGKSAYLIGVGEVTYKDGTQDYISVAVYPDIAEKGISKEINMAVDVYNEPILVFTDKNGYLIPHNGDVINQKKQVEEVLKGINEDRIIRALYEINLNNQGACLGVNAKYIRDRVMAETQVYYSYPFLIALIKEYVDNKFVTNDAFSNLSKIELQELVSDIYCAKVNKDTTYNKLISTIGTDDIELVEAALKDELMKKVLKGDLR